MPLEEDGGEFKFPLIIGVRRKDCKKLTKTRWSGWDDYKKNFAKSYLVEHLDKVLESEKAMAFKEHQYSMDDYRCIHALVENSKFRKIVRKEITDKNHLFIQVLDDLSLMRNDDSRIGHNFSSS